MDADVVVVGAGPAGVAAAHDLANAGRDVLLLDRSDFPRQKPCAGGVTVKALKRLRFSIAPVVRESVSELDMMLYSRRNARFSAQTPVCVMTHRPELDAFCLDQARAAGARFDQLRGISGVRQHSDHVELEAGGTVIRSRYLIGADGAHSAIRRLVWGAMPLSGAVAIEGLLPRERCVHYPCTRFDFGAIRHGYGWLFPKGDHVNVGLYVWRHGRARPTREALSEFARRSLGSDALEGIQGFPEGTWAGRLSPARGRVLLAGDAAGTVEALLGEGIYGAVVSGQQAAAAIVAGDEVAENYRHLIGAWRDEVASMNRLARLYYGALPLAYGVMKYGLRRRLMDGFARGMTLGQCKREWLGADPART